MNYADVIKYYCQNTDSRNPYIIAREIMKNPAINMKGPEHHILIGSALLAAYHNCGRDIDLPEALATMYQRSSQVPIGGCAAWGNCGSGISTGIFMSIIAENASIADEGWRLANLLSSNSLESIVKNPGPRCCKRSGFLAIEAAVDFVAEHCEVQMELPEKMECDFWSGYGDCPREGCPLFCE